MKLGTYVELLNYVDDTVAAGAYYSKLGLVAVGDDVYTDGRYHLHLLTGEGENPSLRYYGSELDALKESGLELVDNTLTSPTGVKILLDAAPAPRQLPHDSVAKAPDITRLGKFGELSVMTDDLETEAAFWEAAGYETLGKYTEPMPWGIWCDEMYLIGIHQYGMIEPFSITHFDPNMKDVNAKLVEQGFELEPFMDSPDESDLTHATLMTPYGIKFYLFTGDISEAKP